VHNDIESEPVLYQSRCILAATLANLLNAAIAGMLFQG
jgi:nucleoside permease NupC